MRSPLAIFALLLALAPAAAQRPGATGTVTGTVTCADSNLPARLIRVALYPVSEQAQPPARTTVDPVNAAPAQTFVLHQTHLDGTFSIAHVQPGRYYVIAQQPGYLSPVTMYTREEIEHPTAEQRKVLDESVPSVVVAANQTSQVQIRMIRAASISGTIRYDDGSPVPGLGVRFKHQDRDGKWVDTVAGRVQSDDLGRFHASGLPAADYQLSTQLYVDEFVTDQIFGASSSSSSSTKQNITLYFGDTFFRKDAKTLKVEDGQDVTADFTVPVSKLHSISGTLVDAQSGHIINAGTLRLFTSENEEIATARVERDDASFRFEFVPEGEYTLRIKDARDVVREPVPLPPGRFVAVPEFKETVVKAYGPYEAPYLVQADQTGVTVPVPPLSPKAGAAPDR